MKAECNVSIQLEQEWEAIRSEPKEQKVFNIIYMNNIIAFGTGDFNVFSSLEKG